MNSIVRQILALATCNYDEIKMDHAVRVQELCTRMRVSGESVFGVCIYMYVFRYETLFMRVIAAFLPQASGFVMHVCADPSCICRACGVIELIVYGMATV